MPEFETKDSGQHAEYASGMVREWQKGKPRFALMLTKRQPYGEQMLTRYASLLARGAVKYDSRNWEEGDSEEELERAKESLLRHVMQLLSGETDEDHAAAAWFNIQAIEYFRWRIAEKKKSSNMTMSFDFRADTDGAHLIEILTGGTVRMVRGDLTPLPRVNVDPVKQVEEIWSEFVGKAPDLPKVIDEPTPKHDFQRVINDWHNRMSSQDIIRKPEVDDDVSFD